MNMQQTIVMDLDDTICIPIHGRKDSYEKYGMASPNDEIINSLKIARDKGYRIVIHTARRMVTHDGDINKIIDDVGKITTDWLEKHEVPYDEIIWGKPYGVYYVDDKAMLPQEFVKFIEWD